MFRKNNDLESGGGAQQLYPVQLDSPELRWGFIRKVYSIIAIQLLVTIAVAAVVVTVKPIAHFFTATSGGLALLCPLYYYHQKHPVNYLLLAIFTISLAFAVGLTCAYTSVLCPLYYYHQKHPVNYLLLAIFTISLAFAVGLTCAYTSGKVILESAILTSAVVLSLTLYTFWAAKRGHDFNFLGPFLFGALVVLIIFSLIQIFFPLGRLGVMIYGCVASIIFCGYIVYDTDNLIKRYTYDQYIWAAVALYLDIINLFLSLLTVFRAADS